MASLDGILLVVGGVGIEEGTESTPSYTKGIGEVGREVIAEAVGVTKVSSTSSVSCSCGEEGKGGT
jgi:hypothetical protein